VTFGLDELAGTTNIPRRVSKFITEHFAAYYILGRFFALEGIDSWLVLL
jgi:hypothetical protein